MMREPFSVSLDGCPRRSDRCLPPHLARRGGPSRIRAPLMVIIRSGYVPAGDKAELARFYNSRPGSESAQRC
jgi:hypothetical protein